MWGGGGGILTGDPLLTSVVHALEMLRRRPTHFQTFRIWELRNHPDKIWAVLGTPEGKPLYVTF